MLFIQIEYSQKEVRANIILGNNKQTSGNGPMWSCVIAPGVTQVGGEVAPDGKLREVERCAAIALRGGSHCVLLKPRIQKK